LRLRIGCTRFVLPRPRYFGSFSVVEVQETGAPLKPAAAARWRAEAPADFAFAVAAPSVVVDLHLDDATRAAVAERAEVADALAAGALLYTTPATFTPTAVHRERLRTFFRDVAPPTEARRAVWEPRGVWAPAEVRALCAELGLAYGVDPVQVTPPPTGSFGYLRIRHLGQGRPLDERRLEKVLLACEGYSEIWVLFDGPSAAEDANHFGRLVAQLVESSDEPDDEDADTET
jgi:uncharacterized protein YecE (DUF72 family)